MNSDVRRILRADIENIRAEIDASADYNFAADVSCRMKRLELSASGLGERCGLSHTIVDKWRKGQAKPNGKERMKELGMALGMDAVELNRFLLNNGYPGLYAKNPLDSAAKLLLMNSAGWPNVVEMYHVLIGHLGLDSFKPRYNPEPLATTVLSMDLSEAAKLGQYSGYFRAHQDDFSGDAKNQLIDYGMVRFILLYAEDKSINEMAVTDELPVTLRNLLYPIFGKKAVPVRGLREKLICFGLYANMNEEEIDTLLQYARLRLFTEPVTRLDGALICAVREAHERYPLYEYENLDRIVKRLKATEDAFGRGLLPEYEARHSNAEQLARYYLKDTLAEDGKLFEEHYTGYSDRGLMDYVHDILILLAEDEVLTQAEIKTISELTGRSREGETVWS